MASLEVIFRSGARADIAEAVAHYAAEDDERLLPRFLSALEATTERIGAFPLASPKYIGNARRVLLTTFPYWVYYRVAENWVEIFAILHYKRSPAFVRKRAK